MCVVVIDHLVYLFVVKAKIYDNLKSCIFAISIVMWNVWFQSHFIRIKSIQDAIKKIFFQFDSEYEYDLWIKQLFLGWVFFFNCNAVSNNNVAYTQTRFIINLSPFHLVKQLQVVIDCILTCSFHVSDRLWDVVELGQADGDSDRYSCFVFVKWTFINPVVDMECIQCVHEDTHF